MQGASGIVPAQHRWPARPGRLVLPPKNIHRECVLQMSASFRMRPAVVHTAPQRCEDSHVPCTRGCLPGEVAPAMMAGLSIL